MYVNIVSASLRLALHGCIQRCSISPTTDLPWLNIQGFEFNLCYKLNSPEGGVMVHSLGKLQARVYFPSQPIFESQISTQDIEVQDEYQICPNIFLKKLPPFKSFFHSSDCLSVPKLYTTTQQFVRDCKYNFVTRCSGACRSLSSKRILFCSNQKIILKIFKRYFLVLAKIDKNGAKIVFFDSFRSVNQI